MPLSRQAATLLWLAGFVLLMGTNFRIFPLPDFAMGIGLVLILIGVGLAPVASKQVLIVRTSFLVVVVLLGLFLFFRYFV